MSFKIDVRKLREISESFSDPEIENMLRHIASDKGVVAIISQAVADNFEKEGPGWAPLKIKTIRYSVAKKLGKQLAGMSDAEIEASEKKSRVEGTEAFRRILRKTGLLFRTATTPGYSGSSVSGDDAKTDEQRAKKRKKNGAVPSLTQRKYMAKKTVRGSNIYKVEGTNITYGTDLVYASTHNQGDGARGIPPRPFLVIRPEWMRDIEEFWYRKAKEIVRSLKGMQP